MTTCIVIPARLSSTRLPNKPLLDICGKPMIERVYDQAVKSKLADKVYFAVCDRELGDAIDQFDGNYIMTRKDHVSGTDRIEEAISNIDCDLVINLQGDEPLINPDYIDDLIKLFKDEDIYMASLMVNISEKEAENPNQVKVVCDKNNNALYFSRSKIPFPRNNFNNYLGHIGIYGYRKEFLIKYAKQPKTSYEEAESLEQLRVLENGYKIKMLKVDEKPLGVDTLEDYKNVCKIFKEQKY